MEHLKKHGAEAPPVHCWAVWVAPQHLRSEVLWSSTECVHDPPYGHPFFTKPKVSQHHMTLTVQQDVFWFEVSGRETNRTVENWFTSRKKNSYCFYFFVSLSSSLQFTLEWGTDLSSVEYVEFVNGKRKNGRKKNLWRRFYKRSVCVCVCVCAPFFVTLWGPVVAETLTVVWTGHPDGD